MADDGRSTPSGPRVCVVALTSLLTVTIEADLDGGGPDVHVHHGGQGLWLARMAATLGGDVVVCGPFGGETGDLVAHLARRDGLDLRPTPYAGRHGVYVHDRRDGERDEVVRTDPTPLDRHELDDLYGAVLVQALDSDVVALTGAEPPEAVPDELFGRLAADLRAAGHRVVADLSGGAAAAAVEPGVDVLKMSHEELQEGGWARGAGRAALVTGARRVLDAGGVGTVVVSRAADPTLVVTERRVLEVETPQVSTVDHRGAGDSMTAGLAVGLGRGDDLEAMVRLAAAAGALNATRHGLGTGRREQIERFADEVVVRDVD